MSDVMMRPVTFGLRRADGRPWDAEAYSRLSETTPDGMVFGCWDQEDWAYCIVFANGEDAHDPGEVVPVEWDWVKREYVDVPISRVRMSMLIYRDRHPSIAEWLDAHPTETKETQR